MTAFVNRTIAPFALLTALLILSLLAAGLTQEYYFLLLPFAALLFYAGWQHPYFVFYLLLFSLPFSFEYNFTPSLGTDIPDEGLMLLTTLLFGAYWLYKPALINKNVLQHPLTFLLLLHVGWIIITTVGSEQPFLSFKFLLAKSWYVGAFVMAPFMLFKNKRTLAVSAIILSVSMLVVTVIALIRHYSDTFSFSGINEAVAPFFRNHVNYSSMLVCVIPLFVAFYWLSKKPVAKYWLIAVLLTLLSALFFAYARGAWLALLTGVIAAGLIIKRKMLIGYIAALTFVIGLLFWLKTSDRYIRYAHDFKTTIFHEDFKEHLVATYKLKDVSTAERFYRWIAGVRMIKEKPLNGFGPGTFYENYKPYAVPAFKTWVSDNKERSTVHNYFLLLLIEQGIPGLFFFLLLLGAMLYYSQHLYQRTKDIFYRTAALVTGVIIVMIATLNFLSDLIETDKVGSLFFLCLATLVMIDVNTRNESKPAADIQRIP